MCSVPAASDHRRQMFGQAVRSMTQGASRALYDEVAFDRHRVTSAFFDATGVRIRSAPMTPGRVRAVLTQAGVS